MSRFINPFTDYGFKKIFGQEVSKDLLLDFLNVLLEGERVITDLTFLNNEQVPMCEADRASIYDIYCTTDTGEQIIVEMQNQSQIHFKERALYYLSRAIINQGEKGRDWKFDIKAVYGVFLMNFLIDENTKLRTDVIMIDRESGELFTDKLREIFIALPRFSKSETECDTDFERWIYVLNNMETLQRMPYKA
ncbi:MAG: Rpn family recombination-promoting nuclease/putative transposase, partial [Bacteroides sp.]